VQAGPVQAHGPAAHHPELRHHFESMGRQKEAASLGMWVFIAQEIMFFGGLFCAYAVYRSLYPEAWAEASHHLDYKLGAVNTAVLICSSLTMAMAVHAAALGHARQIVGYILATVALGSVFLGVKVVEYKDKFTHHLVPGASFSFPGPFEAPAEIFYALYFAMTGLHALHMIIGVPILLTIAWQAYRGRYGPAYHTPVEMVGLYWHFVDIVWIFLFPMLYLVGHR
jgi:cytochrome c oxidase subunit 3